MNPMPDMPTVNSNPDMVNGMAQGMDHKLHDGEIPMGPFGTIGYLEPRQMGKLNAIVHSKRRLQLMMARMKS